MKKMVSAIVAAALVAGAAFAQEKVYLWPNKKGPGSEKVKVAQEVSERSKVPNHQNRVVSGVTEPYFEIFKPAEGVASTKKSILVIPGGAYARVVIDTEGYDYIKGYTDAGYTVFVLTYRTPNDGHKNNDLVALQDAQRAVRMIRANADKYGVSAFGVGVMGSSAGGHVAASLATRFKEETYKAVDAVDKDAKGEWVSAKPAFQILVYPVITMQDKGCHAGSRKALLGEKPDQKAKDAASCELLVTGATPPAFVVCAADDKSVNPYANAVAYWNAMSAKGSKCELHIFPESGHGFGVLNAYGTASKWQQMSIDWMKTYM